MKKFLLKTLCNMFFITFGVIAEILIFMIVATVLRYLGIEPSFVDVILIVILYFLITQQASKITADIFKEDKNV